MNRFVWLLVPCLWGLAAQVHADAPALIPVQGFLTDADGVPIDGEHRLDFVLYDAATDGNSLYVTSYKRQQIDAGHFVVYLGDQAGKDPEDLDLALFSASSNIWLEVVIDTDQIISPRTRLGSVPFAGFAQYCGEATDIAGGATVNGSLTVQDTLYARVHNADAEPNCGAGDAGLIYFNTAAKQFFGCNGTHWTALSNEMPTLYKASVTADTLPPNTDASCDVTANSPWTAVPGMEVSMDLERASDIRVNLSGAIADYGSLTVGLHCAVRYIIDGEPGAAANPSWGHYTWSTDTFGWHGVGAERRFALAAGPHTIRVEARSGLCSPPAGYEANLCLISTAYGVESALGLTMHVEVP